MDGTPPPTTPPSSPPAPPGADRAAALLTHLTAAGYAALRAYHPLRAAGVWPTAALLPAGHDPASVAQQHGSAALRGALDVARGAAVAALQGVSAVAGQGREGVPQSGRGLPGQQPRRRLGSLGVSPLGESIDIDRDTPSRRSYLKPVPLVGCVYGTATRNWRTPAQGSARLVGH